MYDRYIPPDTVYHPVEDPDAAPFQEETPPSHQSAPQPAGSKPPSLLPGGVGQVGQEVSKALSGLLKDFSHLDTGDILLILIVLFLFLEKEDNLDLAIALGLALLMGLGGKEDQPST